jgi:hypothetical protein
MTAWLPPLAKKCETAYPSSDWSQSPPQVRSKSAHVKQVIGRVVDPRMVRPTKAVTEVATPVIVRTPLGSSSTYTPGQVGDAGIAASTRARTPEA